MSTLSLLQTFIVLHIVGLTMMAGTTLIDTLVYKQFWKQYRVDTIKAAGTLETAGKLAVLFGIGFLLLLISGMGMMWLTRGVYGEQIWFRIKMILVVLVLINGLAVGRRTGLQVRKTVVNADGNALKLAALKKRLLLFHVIQLLLFLSIFVLGVFKFN